MDPTLPFPNRVLKRPSADNTARATVLEDRSRPEQSGFFCGKIFEADYFYFFDLERDRFSLVKISTYTLGSSIENSVVV